MLQNVGTFIRSAAVHVVGKSLRCVGLVAIVFLCLTATSRAHPHVFITVETTVLHSKGNLTALEHKWTFDEYYTATALDGFNKNEDGTYDARQLAELAKVNADGLKEFGYFTYAALGDQPVKIGEVGNYRIEHKDGLLSLIFTLPFSRPIALASGKELSIIVLDPSYFIAFEFAKTDPVRLAQGAPASCTVAIHEVAEGSADAERLTKAFAELGPDLS
jgi:ABC-type uncharacterized transport system substrate-binding protein